MKEFKHRVRRSVYPTNRIIFAEHGIHQVLFPYSFQMCLIYLNLSVSFGIEINRKYFEDIQYRIKKIELK